MNVKRTNSGSANAQHSTSSRIIVFFSIIVLLLIISVANQSILLKKYAAFSLGKETKQVVAVNRFNKETKQVVAVNRFNSYAKFNGVVTEHRSCNNTIIVQSKTDKIQWRDQPFPELLVGDNTDVFSSQPNKDDMLCLQMGSFVGAFFLSSAGQPYSVESVLLSSQETESILKKIKNDIKHTDNLEFRVVARKSIVMKGWYKPASPETKLARSLDGNSGNFLWEFGATRMINPYMVKFYEEAKDAPSEESISALVIATANALHIPRDGGFEPTKNFITFLTNTAQKVDQPTIVLGIGIQAKFNDLKETGNLKLHEHQVAFMDEVDKRGIGKSVSVRGNITETACRNSNITNCLSLGCPSLTISRSPDLGQVLESKWNSVASRLSKGKHLRIGIALPAIQRTIDAEFYEMFVDLLFSICEDHECHFIIQASYDEGQFLKYAKEKGKKKFTKKSMLHFKTGVEDWFEFMHSLDFVVSCRIHGGMAGIINDVPTIIIPHDYRIMELVNAMMLPYISIDDAVDKGVSSLVELMSVANKDFKAFEVTRISRLYSYKRMLESIDLEMDPELLAIM